MTLPLRPVDDDARTLAREMLAEVRHAVLATLDPDTGAPHLSRIALHCDAGGLPVALLSPLAAHTRALQADPRAGLLIDPAGPDRRPPLARPRLSIQVRATCLPPGDMAQRARWRAQDPKSAVYLDLPDFRFWRLYPVSALLNAGFGQAFRLSAADLHPDGETPAEG